MKCLFFILFITTSAFSQTTGLGLTLGNPTGLNAKHWLSSTQAIDAGLGWSIGGDTDFTIHSDYLLHRNSFLYFDKTYALDLYYGLGGRIEFDTEIDVGVRVPVGLAHRFNEKKLDVFLEFAPIVNIISSLGVEIHLLIGGRYYF